MAEANKTIELGRTPWGVWWSLAAGFLAWGLDLGLSYTLEQHSCSTGHHYVLHAISAVCFAIALTGFASGFTEFRRFSPGTKEEGRSGFDRAYFQALLGMSFSVWFCIVVVANAVPRWILSPCE